MQMVNESGILVENCVIRSRFLHRNVKFDLYHPNNPVISSMLPLLLINDGQDMEVLGLKNILREMCYETELVQPLCCVAIHCGPERKREYGVASTPDYKGRGDKAALYTAFVMEELLPFLHTKFRVDRFVEYSFAGFSLGALSAMDIAWNSPGLFSRVGLFSASLWWRSLDQHDPDYDDDSHRIMHQQVRQSLYAPSLKFFFQCGNLDEVKDRNKNGIIDSIDDTMDLINELELKGFEKGKDIFYIELPDGHHDVPTWSRAMPVFLQWGWGQSR